MKQKYLLIGVGIILTITLFILILFTITLRKNSNQMYVNNFQKTQSNNSFSDSKLPNGAIDDITTLNTIKISPTIAIAQEKDLKVKTFKQIAPSNSESNNQINEKDLIRDSQNNNNRILATPQPTKYEIPNPIISSNPTPSIFLAESLDNVNTPTPLPTAPYGIPTDEKNEFLFMGTKLGPAAKSDSTISFPKLKNIPSNKSGIVNNKLNQSQFRYFSQCDGGFDEYPLPQGCTVCESGCGPTTIAMVLSAYLGKNITPADVVEIYKNNEYFAGCDGTKITDAKTVLDTNGLQTTDFMILTPMLKEDAVKEMKKYIDAGWSIFMLGRYCDSGCNHFFWITDIDENYKVWTYDPFFGKNTTPPLDVSHYDPYPEYRIAFGIKN